MPKWIAIALLAVGLCIVARQSYINFQIADQAHLKIEEDREAIVSLAIYINQLLFEPQPLDR